MRHDFKPRRLLTCTAYRMPIDGINALHWRKIMCHALVVYCIGQPPSEVYFSEAVIVYPYAVCANVSVRRCPYVTNW